jgi:hypothetical protein
MKVAIIMAELPQLYPVRFSSQGSRLTPSLGQQEIDKHDIKSLLTWIFPLTIHTNPILQRRTIRIFYWYSNRMHFPLNAIKMYSTTGYQHVLNITAPLRFFVFLCLEVGPRAQMRRPSCSIERILNRRSKCSSDVTRASATFQVFWLTDGLISGRYCHLGAKNPRVDEL